MIKIKIQQCKRCKWKSHNYCFVFLCLSSFPHCFLFGPKFQCKPKRIFLCVCFLLVFFAQRIILNCLTTFSLHCFLFKLLFIALNLMLKRVDIFQLYIYDWITIVVFCSHVFLEHVLFKAALFQ